MTKKETLLLLKGCNCDNCMEGWGLSFGWFERICGRQMADHEVCENYKKLNFYIPENEIWIETEYVGRNNV